MADETTTTTEAPLTNSTEARTADGTLKDQGTTILTQQPDTQVEKTSADGTTLLTEGDKKPEGEADKKDEKVGAPEKYEPFTAPEGHEYTPESVAEASTLFKELGLNQAQAQKLMDTYGKKALEAQKAYKESGQQAIKAMNDKWIAAVKADPEIGGKLGEVRVAISKALDSLGDPVLVKQFRQEMDDTGIGNNPFFVKTFFKLAQQVIEGGHVAGSGPSPHGQSANGKATPQSLASLMYNRT